MHAFIYMYVACSEGTCLLLMDDSAILRSCIRVGNIFYVALHNARTVRAVMYVYVCVCLSLSRAPFSCSEGQCSDHWEHSVPIRVRGGN